MPRGAGTRHSPSQIVDKLRDCDAMINAGKPVSEVVQHLGIGEQTYCRWRNQYGGMKSEEAKRLTERELENTRLKKCLSEAELDRAMLKESAAVTVMKEDLRLMKHSWLLGFTNWFVNIRDSAIDESRQG